MAADGQAAPPLYYAVALFPGFQSLDVFGPLDALNLLSHEREIKLSLIGPTLDPVSTKNPNPNSNRMNSTSYQSIVPTHTYDAPPERIDVLLVPGGFGTRYETINPVVKFIADTYPRVRYLLTVCTGSYVAARAGVLDGKNATTNKMRFDGVAKETPKVNWIRRARWVVDGNIWTSSGISAGIDEMLAFVEAMYGRELALHIATEMEYQWHEDSTFDPFAESELVKKYAH
ncbi:hypothetical protein FQN55_007951 [Onygenales sp. PD_40]|nr:hypothetical protein FQN55_007951 [Onygenales sp. PD_40]KAK2783494.1 hypothetical protein FQN52_009614 [Onygenales sp. PD_12]KAK2789548.1 hypothetical protein FQN53_001667 [Emmonsiellopsis sp. PD_33]